VISIDETVRLDVHERGYMIAKKGMKKRPMVLRGSGKASTMVAGTICMSGAK
jgi:hypothetical protein